MASQLARIYRVEMGRPLNVRAFVLDSGPGDGTFKKTAGGIIAALPNGILYVYFTLHMF